MMKRKTSIYEIATEVGVHPSTVSRALNGKPGVAADLKARILRVAEEMDYHPDTLWVAGRADYKNVGVFTGSRTTPTAVGQFYYDVLQGIRTELSEHGYNLLLCETPNEGGHAAYEKFCDENGVAGAIFVGSGSSEALREFRPSTIPQVLVDASADDLEVDCVVSDNFGGVVRSTKRLIAKGHSQIAFVGAGLEIESIAARQRGYAAAMEGAGLETRSFYADRLDMESGSLVAAEIAGADARPTALVVANDELAIGVMNGLQAAGVRIPDDIAVVGFDGIEWSAYVQPALTTISVNRVHMGRVAVRRMMAQIMHKEHIPTTTMMYTSLVLRDSA